MFTVIVQSPDMIIFQICTSFSLLQPEPSASNPVNIYHSIFKYQFRLQCKLSFASLDAAKTVFAWKKVQRLWRETQESRNISKFHGKSNSNHSMQFIAFFRMISFQMEYFIENQCILVSIEFAIHFHFFCNLINALLWSYHHFIGKHSGSPVSLTNYKNVNIHILFLYFVLWNIFFFILCETILKYIFLLFA